MTETVGTIRGRNGDAPIIRVEFLDGLCDVTYVDGISRRECTINGGFSVNTSHLEAVVKEWLEKRGYTVRKNEWEPIKANPKHGHLEQYVDDDGYTCFLQTEGIEGPGIFWALHYAGWEAFINSPDRIDPIYKTGNNTFPTDKHLQEAKNCYEDVMAEINEQEDYAKDLRGFAAETH